MKYIDCKKYAQEILDDVRKSPNKGGTFVIISVGNNPASQSYIKGKIKDCEYCGIKYEHWNVDADAPLAKETLAGHLRFAARSEDITSVILQLPLPDGWDENYFLSLIPPRKDVDGLGAKAYFKPCTPEGIVYILHKEIGDLTSKKALIIGRGKLVGRPLFDMLLDENCVVTVTHSKAESLDVSDYDIVVAAAGVPSLVPLGECCGKSALLSPVVIDAGINKVNGKLCGDCALPKYKWAFDKFDLRVTPVPNGIGLMTRAMLMQHIIMANTRNVWAQNHGNNKKRGKL